MYTKESSQQNFKIPNKNLDMKFYYKGLPKPQQWNTTDQKSEQGQATIYYGKVSKHNDFDAEDTFRLLPVSSAVQ